MRVIRLIVIAAAIAVLGAVLAPEAHALRFADSPCVEGEGRARFCPEAVVGQSYAVTLEGEGGCGPALPYQYRLLNGTLPPGISLSPDGRLSGRPTTAGNWDFWLEISDQNPPSASWCVPVRSEREFRIRVGAPTATVGKAYSLALGPPGSGAQTWSIATGALPPGLALGETTGTITGVPSRPGAFQLSVSSLDEAGRSARFDFVLTVFPRLTVTTVRLVPVRVGHRFQVRLRAQGAVGGVTYRVVSGRFPVGIRLDTRTGIIRGAPRKAGVYRVRIQVLDSLGRTVTEAVALRVRASKP